MKTGKHIIIASLLLTAVSCQVQEMTHPDDSVMRFYASGEGTETRTQLGEDYWGEMNRLYWSPADEIRIYCKGIEGKFVSSNTEATSETVEFQGTLPVRNRGDHPFWAVYPYSEDSILDGSSLETSLPAVQEAVAGNVQQGLMVSLARSQNANLYFRHLFGAIRIGVFEEGIKRIVFKGNNGETVAGKVRATLDEKDIPVITDIRDSAQVITLLPPDGGTFNVSEAYYVICLPGSFEKGYTIEFYRDELVSMKKIDTPVNLPRASMARLFDLYSGGIICSTESNGRSYEVRYKVRWEDGRDVAEYWVTIDDKVIAVPAKFNVSRHSSPTKMGPAVAIDTEKETVFLAMVKEMWDSPVEGVVYKVTSSGFEVKHPVVGYYPCFWFDEGQQRMELHSYGNLEDDRSCSFWRSYHDKDGEWVRAYMLEDTRDYESSGYYQKKLSDIICLYHESAPAEQSKAVLNLGLSVNWAACNIGASSPEQYGEYYAWGETSTKHDYSWQNYSFYDGEFYFWNHPAYFVWHQNGFCVPVFTKYNHLDQKDVLDPEDDVAHVKWGDHWRMPTQEEWQELIDNCTWESATVHGVLGQMGTSLKNGETIFLPGASFREGVAFNDEYPGTATYHSSNTDHVWGQSNHTDLSYLVGTESAYIQEEYSNTGYGYRWKGLPVRPVYGFVALEDVVLEVPYLELIPGDSAVLGVKVIPENATNRTLSWSSSNESVVTVSQSGVVKAVSEGEAIVTVTVLEEARTASCRVVVKYGSSFIDIPEMVDMGLSVKWASFNVGASRPEEVGYYFAWGEVRPKDDYDMGTYKWCADGYYNRMTKYCVDPSYGFNGFTDNKTVLDPEDDAAYVNYGGKWRMPTKKELIELCENTSFSPATLNGVSGFWVTSNFNGNRFFFPRSGYRSYDFLREETYGFSWSSSLSEDSIDASYLILGSYLTWSGRDREDGLPVRAVYGDPAQGGNEDITPGGDINM